jgi:hypothetical protein
MYYWYEFLQNQVLFEVVLLHIQFPAWIRDFFYSHNVQTASVNKSTSYSKGNVGFSPRLKQLGRKPERSFPSAAELKNEWSPAFTNHMPSWGE